MKILSIGFFPYFYTLTDTIKETSVALSNIGHEVVFVNGHLGPRRYLTYQRMRKVARPSPLLVVRQQGDLLPYSLYRCLSIPKNTGRRLKEIIEDSDNSNYLLYRSTSAPEPWELTDILGAIRNRIFLDVVEVLDAGLPMPRHLGIPQLVVGVNAMLADNAMELLGRPVPVVPQGVAKEWYSIPTGSKPKVAAYFGNIAMLDVPLVTTAAKQLPD